MKRRGFIRLVGGAAAWPLVASAQQGERVRRIGILLNAVEDDSQFPIWVAAFLQALALLGWTIGRNVRVDIRWAGGSAAEVREILGRPTMHRYSKAPAQAFDAGFRRRLLDQAAGRFADEIAK